MVANPALIIDRGTVQAILGIDDCIDTIEHAFRQYGVGKAITPGVLGTHVDGGGFHVKTAGLVSNSPARSMFAAKVNANFPGNPTSRGLPTIQGVIALFDAVDGQVLAILDSIEITSIRTAAATAVAARYLARDDAATVTICGCGEQGRSQLRALARVRPIHHVWAFDIDHEKAERFAHELHGQLDAHITAVREIGAATRDAAIWVTCTPSRRWFVGREHVAPGTFIAAVGADNAEKQEISPDLLASSTVVVDVLDQCAAIGDLHHALALGVMCVDDVHAELADIVVGRRRGRADAEEIIVFDSTGTALQDVAAATLVYDRAVAAGAGVSIALGATAPVPDVQAMSRQ